MADDVLEEFVGALKRAIRAQDRKRLEELFRDPVYGQLTPLQLSLVLEEFSYFLQESDLLIPFVEHPAFENFTPNAVGHLLLVAIRLNNHTAIELLVHHWQSVNISEELTHQIIQATLEFQDRNLMALLVEHLPKAFKVAQSHLKEVVACAIRTRDNEWLETIFKHKHYPDISEQVFADVIRWAFRRRDQKLIQLAIRYQHFNENVEAILQQELLGAKEGLELDVLEQLMNHPDYDRFSASMLSWLAEKALDLHHDDLFYRFESHAAFPHIPASRLGNLFMRALKTQNRLILSHLMNHPQFKDISGDPLGLILEQAVEQHDLQVTHSLIHHPHFELIPEDAFKRIVFSVIQSAKELLQDPDLKVKYEKVIYEAIRRNETDLIDRFLQEPALKHEVLEQLARYAVNPLLVNEYIIRDVIRETVMAMDQELIIPLMAHPLFDRRIIELIDQAIGFDDDELIEKLILDEHLYARFKERMNQASSEDRKRLFHIFTSQPQFNQKAKKIREEVLSWLEEPPL